MTFCDRTGYENAFYLCSDKENFFRCPRTRRPSGQWSPRWRPRVSARRPRCRALPPASWWSPTVSRHSTPSWSSHLGILPSKCMHLVWGFAENHWLQHQVLRPNPQCCKEHFLDNKISQPPRTSIVESIWSSHQMQSGRPSRSHKLSMKQISKAAKCHLSRPLNLF